MKVETYEFSKFGKKSKKPLTGQGGDDYKLDVIYHKSLDFNGLLIECLRH
jgi:hypothetical protein